MINTKKFFSILFILLLTISLTGCNLFGGGSLFSTGKSTIEGTVIVSTGDLSGYKVENMEVMFIGPNGQEYNSTIDKEDNSTFKYSVEVANTGSYDAEIKAVVGEYDSSNTYMSDTAEYSGVVIVEEGGSTITQDLEFPLGSFFSP